MTARNPVSGRFIKMTPDDLVPENVSGTDVRAGMEVPRYAPAGDTLAGQPHPGLLHPRIARTVSGGSEREVYATPHNATLNDAVHTGESGRPWAQQSAYILSDVDETAPGEVAATQRFGVQGAHVRAVARRSSDPTTRFITGADDD